MTSLTKKLMTVLFVLLAAACLALSVVLVPTDFTAAEGEAVLTLDDFTTEEDGSGYMVTGLSPEGQAKIRNGEKFIIDLTDSNIVQLGTDSDTSSFLTSNYVGNLVDIIFSDELVKIGAYAFYGCTGLNDLDLSDATNLQEIGTYAFACSNASSITTITVPQNVTMIGDMAFANHTNVTQINFYASNCADFYQDETSALANAAAVNPFYRVGRSGSGVTVNIGSAAYEVNAIPAFMFANSSGSSNRIRTVNFTNVALDSESSFGAYAFAGCASIAEVDLGNVSSIGAYAFYGCTELASVSVPATVTSIGANAFTNCSALTTVTLPSGVSSIGGEAFRGCGLLTTVGTNEGIVNFPISVRTIGARAFYGCNSISEIVIPQGITSIGRDAFAYISDLNKISYNAVNAAADPNGVFRYSGSAVEAEIGRGNTSRIESVPTSLFRGTNIATATLYNISNTATFGSEVFENCSLLTSVVFDSSCELHLLNERVFANCPLLRRAVLPTRLEAISNNMFEGCASLYSIDLGAVQSIGTQAFLNCSALYRITFPASITSIGSQAFMGCTKLLEVQNLSSSVQMTAGSTDGHYAAYYARNVYGASGSSNISTTNDFIVYSDAGSELLLGYAGNATQINLADAGFNGSFEIYVGAFKNNNTITSVTIPATVNHIRNDAFMNCTALTSINLPSSILDFGTAVFSGCSALTTVTLPDVSIITASMFEGCEGLTSISIPSTVTSIGASAFRNCGALRTINFNGNNLLTIGQNAFTNCRRLTVVDLPDSVTALGGYAFSGCERLTTVYLPTALGNYSVTGLFDGCSNNLLLIAPYSSYSSYNRNLSVYGTVSYTVNVYLVYGNYVADPDSGNVQIVQRLHGFDYNYVRQANGSWLNNGDMPVQDGYERSVWYTGSDYSNRVDGDGLTALLRNSTGESIALYANYFEIPTFTLVSSNVSYTENAGWNWGEIFSDYLDNTKNPIIGGGDDRTFNISIDRYTLISGADGDVDIQTMDAGTYTLKVSIAQSDLYGSWAGNDALKYTFRVNPLTIDIASDIVWNIVNDAGATQSRLDDSELWLYGNANDKSTITPYSAEQSEMPQFIENRTFNNAVALYRGNTSYTVALQNSNYYTIREYAAGDGKYGDGDGVIKSGDNFIGVRASQAGAYEVEVTLLAGNNYSLRLTIGENNSDLMWSQSVTSNGYEYTLIKTWYIAMDSSNALLLGGSAFDLPILDSEEGTKGWVFGDSLISSRLASPTLSGTPGQEENIITFTLASVEVWGDTTPREFTYAQYPDVINYTMPAGYYSLTINIGVDEEGLFSAYSLNYEFQVEKATYEDKLRSWGVAGQIYGDLYNSTSERVSVTLNYVEGAVQFADTSSLQILNVAPSVIYEREGIWDSPAFNDLYSAFKITYNLNGFSNYYEESYFDTAEQRPSALGRYTVYFNISSPNYVPLVNPENENERHTYYYNLFIKRVVDVEELGLGSLVYTGSEKRFNDSDFYKFVYLDGNDEDAIAARALKGNDEYVNAGTHTVAVMIRDDYADSYAWLDGNDVRQSNGKTFAFREFVIAQAANYTTEALSMSGWVWGQAANSPRWSTRFVTEVNQFTFRLVSVDDPSVVYYYRPTESGQRSFDEAHAGSYSLIATAPGGTGYNWSNNGAYTVTYPQPIVIEQASLTLSLAPYMESWRYGDFETGYVAPTLEFTANYSDVDVNFYYIPTAEYESYLNGDTQWDDLTKFVDIIYMTDDIGEVPVGRYTLVYRIAEGSELSSDFRPWSYSTAFEVIRARNFWNVTPSMHDWVYGDYTTRDTSILGEPNYGSSNYIVYRYRRVDENNFSTSEWQTDLSRLDLDSNGELSVGRYEFEAFLAGTDDYEDLRLNLYFNVLKADNSWVSDGVPSVMSWSQGHWDAQENALKAQSVWGNVTYKVFAADDVERENELDITNLNALEVGSYVLVATVNGTDDYEVLSSETSFAVFEDSVGMTGIIAVTIVFAVIAIVLAISGVILLIRRNNMIEKEFRRMVRTELRRK